MRSPALVVNDGNIVDDYPASSINGNAKHEHTIQNGSASAVLHRSLHNDPLQVITAKGNHLHLSNGQSIFDATGGAAVACLGHGNQRLRDAVLDQMDKVSYCHSLFYGTEATEELAQTLVDSTYGEMSRAFIVSSGSEAMEAALKLARQYHLEKRPSEKARTYFISRQQSYHGTTLGALAVGGHVARRALYEPMLGQNTSRVSPCFKYRGMEDGESESSYVSRLEAELEQEFQRIGPQNVAAFIAEPVVGAALGCVPAVQGYFRAVRRVCDRHGALLILDEIMSGCGRIGPEPTNQYIDPIHAWQDPLIGVVPDIMTMGKGLGGGYMPVAAVMANHKVIDTLYRGTGAFSHGQTYQGHPVACRAAVEVQRVIRDENLMTNVRKQGKLLGKLLQQKLANHWAVGDVRGKGLFWGIELVSDKTIMSPFRPEEAVAMGIHELAMKEPFSISLYPGTGTVDGRSGDHILVAPAYNVIEDEVRYIVDTTAKVIHQFFRQYARPSENGHMK